MSDRADTEHPRLDVPDRDSAAAREAGCTCCQERRGTDINFTVGSGCSIHGPVPALPSPPSRVNRSVRRDLVRQVAPYLWNGETPRYAFSAAYGPSTAYGRRMQPHYGIVVTDRAVIVFQPRRTLRFKSADEVRRLPRSTRFALGGHRLPYRRADLAGERIWVHWQFAKDARQADAELSAAPT